MTEVLRQTTVNIPHNILEAGSLPAHESKGLTLHGSGGVLGNVKLLEPCFRDTPVEEIRRRYLEDGVVWVKGLLDPDFVRKFRSDYLTMVSEGTDMLARGTDPVDGIYGGANWQDFLLPGAVRRALGLLDEGTFVENSIKSHSSAAYQEFKDTVGKQLEPFVGELCGFVQPWCLPRSLLRCAVPGGETTPVHYDQIFLRAGPPTSITAWVPIGDVDLLGGGLIYLNRAHDIGIKYEEDFSKANESLPDAERISAFNKNMEAGGWLDRNASRFGQSWKRDWLVGKYEAGDVVFHNPFSIHAGAKNEDPNNRIRVSTDLRFVDKTKPYDERWTVLAYSENDPNVARQSKH